MHLKGKTAFIAGIGDDKGFGFAIAKALAEAGCKIIVGTWPPLMKIFVNSLESGKFDASRKLKDGSLLQFEKIYPLDASFDKAEDVPQEIRENKRYKDYKNYSIAELAACIEKDYGKIDLLVHALANGPEVKNDLIDTSRAGYLAALSASSYSFVSLLHHFGPIISSKGSALTLSYLASMRSIPGYGGGMSSAKAALESDVRSLAFEAGRRWQLRVNAISAGPYASRAAKAIGFIDKMIRYSEENAPLQRKLEAEDIAHTACFLLSPLASAITASVVYVDNGLHAMGVACDSPSLADM